MTTRLRVSVDVGGTFTDLTCCKVEDTTGEIVEFRSSKVDTTRPSFENGIIEAFEDAEISYKEVDYFAHGSTVVINILTERKGAKTGLITTNGFRDVLEIARGNRPDLFNLCYKKPEPLVPRYLRKEVNERVGYNGEIIISLSVDEINDLVTYFKEEDVEAIAICFLHSYKNPINEIIAMEKIQAIWPDIPVVASHQITRQWREYERTNTTVAAAYVHKSGNSYLNRLEKRLTTEGFRGNAFVMQSNGGLGTYSDAKSFPIRGVESGPAGGINGAAALAELIGEKNIITLDIGGTTAKCSLIDGGCIRITNEYVIGKTRQNAGYPLMIPGIDIVEVGSGGGSIAWVDAGNKIHVGPQSAGSIPGPAAYGLGGMEPTLTDAHLLSGHIDADYFHGGNKADMESVNKAFKKLEKKINLPQREIARGIIRLADNNMANALKLVSINRGYDPREFTMIAFGGGGGLESARLAAQLNIPKVIIPYYASVFSAWGMLITDIRRDYVLTTLSRLEDPSSINLLAETFYELEKKAREEMSHDATLISRIDFERFIELRYVGQEHTVKIQISNDKIQKRTTKTIIDIFEKEYKREYQYNLPGSIELVTCHLVVFGRINKPLISSLKSTGQPIESCVRGHRRVDFDEKGIHDTTIYERSLLEPGMNTIGPVIIEEPFATTVVLPDQTVMVDDFGNLVIDVN